MEGSSNCFDNHPVKGHNGSGEIPSDPPWKSYCFDDGKATGGKLEKRWENETKVQILMRLMEA